MSEILRWKQGNEHGLRVLDVSGDIVYYADHVADKAAAVEKLEAERDWYRRTLEEIDRECSFTENEGLKGIRAMARAVLYPMPVEETSDRTCENCGDDGCAGYIGTEACWTREARVGGN